MQFITSTAGATRSLIAECVNTAGVQTYAFPTTTVAAASLRLVCSVGQKFSSSKIRPTPSNVHLSKIVCQFRSGIGTFCRAARAVERSGAMKKIAAPIRTRFGPSRANRTRVGRDLTGAAWLCTGNAAMGRL